MWNVIDNLILIGGVVYIKVEIDRFNCFEEVECIDCLGLDVLFLFDMKYLLLVEYFMEIEYGFDVYYNVFYIYIDEQYFDLLGNMGEFNFYLLLFDYSMFNVSVSFLFKDDVFCVFLIVKNLFDESYVIIYSGDNFCY